MHVENIVRRAQMQAQELLEKEAVVIGPYEANNLAVKYLIAELINAVQGLNYKGIPFGAEEPEAEE